MVLKHEDAAQEQKAYGELTSLMKGWALALASNDPVAIGRYMAGDWVIVGPAGATKKSQFLAVVESGDLTHETFDFEAKMVRLYQETAVVSGRVKNNGLFKGEAFTVDEWASDVFVKSEGRWLCVFSHITPVAETGCQ